MTTPEELIAHLGFKTLDGSVRTVGLEKFGRPNIEMLLGGQEEDQVAIRILREAAAYTVLKTKVYDGEKIGIPISSAVSHFSDVVLVSSPMKFLLQ